MNVDKSDKAIGAIFRAFAKKEVKPDAGRKLQDRLYKAISDLNKDSRESLIRAFNLVRDYWHEASRASEDEYVTHITELLHLGFVDAGGSAFLLWVDSLAKLDIISLSTVMPTLACADAWMKASKSNKKSILKEITDNTDKYYGSAWGDWFVLRAPFKEALPMVRLALKGWQRPVFLPSAGDMLLAFLKRDKNAVVAEKLALDAFATSDKMRLLVRACASCGAISEPYARTIGMLMAKQGDAESVSVVVDALGGLLQDRSAELTRSVSHFAAHMLTTWRLVGTDKTIAAAEEQLQRFVGDVLFNAQANERNDIWIAWGSGVIVEQVTSKRGKISPQGALEVAFALRSAETDATAADALWSAAFNLGLREIGRVGEVCPFDPTLHEDSKGGLLRGDQVNILKCGWQFGENILVRTLVEPA